MEKLKTIDITAGPFMANGKKYTVSDTLSLDRYNMYEKIEIEMGYGRAWSEIHAELLKAYESLNNGKFADGSVQLYNIINGVKNIKNKQPHALKMCALFINYEGEDVRFIDNQKIEEKVYDWNVEGLNPEPFLIFGVNSISGLTEFLGSLTQNTLSEAEREK